MVQSELAEIQSEEIRRIQHANRLYAVQSAVNRASTRKPQRQELLQSVCRILVETGGFRLAWFGTPDADGWVVPEVIFGDTHGYLDGIRISVLDIPEGHYPTGSAIRERRPCICKDIATNPCLRPWRDAALKQDFHSSGSFPVVLADGGVGGLTVYSTECDFFSSAEECLLAELCTDIGYALELVATEERKALTEVRLEQERTLLKTLVDAVPDLIWLKDSTGVYLACNPSFARFFGATEAEIIGRTEHDFVAAEEADFYRDKDREALAHGSPSRYDRWVTFADDGRRVLLEVIKTPLADRSGRLVGVIGLARDVTEQRQLARDLEISRHHMQTILDNLPMLAWLKDTEGKFLMVNQSFAEAIGRPYQEILGLTDLDVWPRELAEAYRSEDREVIVKQTRKQVEELVEDIRGGIWVETFKTTITDDQGQVVGTVGVARDITERKQAEEELRKSAKLFRSLFEQSAVGLVQTSTKSGRFMRINKKFCDMLGYLPEEMLKLDVQTITHPDDLQDTLDNMDRLKSGSIPDYSLEKRYIHRNGDTVWVRLSVLPLWDEQADPDFHLAVVTDITDWKMAREALQESETRMHLAIASSPIPLMIHDEEDRVLQLSSGWTNYSGYTLEDIPTVADWTERAYGERAGATKQYIDSLVALEQTVNCGERIVTAKDGSQRIWDFQSTPLGKVNKGKRVLLSMATDITERKRAEEELRDTKAILQAAMDQSPAGIAIADAPHGTLRYVNNAGLLIRGGRRRAIVDEVGINQYVERWRLLDFDGRPLRTDEVPLARALLFGETCSREFIIRRTEEEDRIVLANAAPIRDGSGTVVSGIVVFTDITERKMAEAELRRERDRAQGYLDTVETIIIALNVEGNITTINRKGCQVLGFEEGELLGQNWFSTCLPQPEGMERVYPFFLRLIAGELELLLEYQENPLVTRSGEVRHIVWHNSLLRDEQGRRIGTLSAGEDITERKRGEEELAKAKEAAEAANRAKSTFLAHMSHEMRTPLHGVIGMCQLLKNTDMVDRRQEFQNNIELSARNLLDIINDLLDLAKVEAGKIVLEQLDFGLCGLLNEVIALMEPQVRAKGLTLALNLATDVPDGLVGDPLRLKQILVNLVSNAVKFTEQGRITVSGSVAAQRGSTVELLLSVTDTGIGISPKFINTIFAPFSQADASTTRQYGGTGLGLAICRQLAALMGGEIGVESREGSGSTFTVTVPMTIKTVKIPEHQSTGLTRTSLEQLDRPLRILVAEDQAINRLFIVTILRQQGHSVEAAGNGQEALEKWQASSPEVILMDLSMPVMGGREAMENIRSKELQTAGHVTIIALTGYAMNGEKERCLASGFDGYLAKPMDGYDVQEEIARCLALP